MLRTPAPFVKATSMARCPMLSECVTDEGFISITLLILAASGVETCIVVL
jgi:hypothetical protein